MADSGWYETIVDHGYEARAFSTDRQANWAFFPLYPLLTRFLGPKNVVGRSGNHWIGFLLSNVFTLIGLLVLHDLVEWRKDLKTAGVDTAGRIRAIGLL
jgi:hypothetical protein